MTALLAPRTMFLANNPNATLRSTEHISREKLFETTSVPDPLNVLPPGKPTGELLKEHRAAFRRLRPNSGLLPVPPNFSSPVSTETLVTRLPIKQLDFLIPVTILLLVTTPLQRSLDVLSAMIVSVPAVAVIILLSYADGPPLLKSIVLLTIPLNVLAISGPILD